MVRSRSTYKRFDEEMGISFSASIVIQKYANISECVIRSIISGVVSNRLDLIRQGLNEGGSINAVLDPFLGSIIFRLLYLRFRCYEIS